MRDTSWRRSVVIGAALLLLAARHPAQPEPLAAATFDDGTMGAFLVEPSGTVRVVDDPLGAGRGRVAEMRYRTASSVAPAQAALALSLPPRRVGPGGTLTIAGDLLIPASTFNLRNPSIRRTLLSLRAPLDVNPADSTDAFVVIEYTGACELRVEWSHDGYWRGSDCRLAPLEPGRWHRIALRATLNRAPDTADGRLELVVNGTVVLQDSTVRFTSPARPSMPSWQSVRIGATRFRPEVRGGFDLSDGATVDETRYWDNVVVTAERPPSP